MTSTARVAAAVLALAVGAGACTSTVHSATKTPSTSPQSAPAGASSSAPTSPASTPAAGALSVLSEPQAGFGAVYQAVTAATKTVQLTIYELNDQTLETDLAGAAARGVNVQVLFDQGEERAHNTPAYNYLAGHGVHVAWASNRYRYTHQKTLTVDGTTSFVMTANLVSADYPDTADFLVIDRIPADITAIAATFTADFAGQAVTPSDGEDLVWSPTNATSAILGLIGRARTSLLVENEEMADPDVTAALAAAARRGVHVTVTMTANRSYDSAFDQLRSAGVAVDLYPDSSKDLYVHAKAILADAGAPGAEAFVGSENFSRTSLSSNRELGVLTTDTQVVNPVAATMTSQSAAAPEH